MIQRKCGTCRLSNIAAAIFRATPENAKKSVLTSVPASSQATCSMKRRPDKWTPDGPEKTRASTQNYITEIVRRRGRHNEEAGGFCLQ
jgi:hypothetical protein